MQLYTEFRSQKIDGLKIGFAVLEGRHSGTFFEDSGKMKLVFKTEPVGDFTDGFSRGHEHATGAFDLEPRKILVRRHADALPENPDKVLFGKTDLPRDIFNLEIFADGLFHQRKRFFDMNAAFGSRFGIRLLSDDILPAEPPEQKTRQKMQRRFPERRIGGARKLEKVLELETEIAINRKNCLPRGKGSVKRTPERRVGGRRERIRILIK